MSIIQEHNATTGEVTTRPMTPEELAQAELDKAQIAANKANEEAKAIAKAALLDRLNMTEEEAKLLLS
jgi:hypothetical protein